MGSGYDGIGVDVYRPPKPVWSVQIRSVAPQPPKPDQRLAKLQKAIANDPLKRQPRRQLITHLIRQGDTAAQLKALDDWLKHDPYNPKVHWMRGEAQARHGQDAQALRSFGNAVELAPQDEALISRWARQLSLRDRLAMAVAAHQTLAALTDDVDDVLDLITVQSFLDPRTARDRLAKLRARRERSLSRSQKARADQLAEALAGAGATAQRPFAEPAPNAKLKLKGRGWATLTWEGEEDLDLAVVLPHGERISPDQPIAFKARGKRGRVVAESATGHPVGASEGKAPREAIVMPIMPQGTYLVEVTRRGDNSREVHGHVTIRAIGKRRTYPITIPAGERTVRVARVRLQVNRY